MPETLVYFLCLALGFVLGWRVGYTYACREYRRFWRVDGYDEPCAK